MRIVAVSATLPNGDDIATFLECSAAHVFDGSYRPVPLTTHVIGCGSVRNNQYLFDKSLNSMVPSILRDYSDDKPAIVFCHTKKETEILALDLTNRGLSHASPDDMRTLAMAAKKASTSILQKCLRAGMAYHHAGLELNSVPEEHHVGSSKCEDV